MSRKICPLLSSKKEGNSLQDDGTFIGEHLCEKDQCGFWDSDGKKCGIATLGEIATYLFHKT